MITVYGHSDDLIEIEGDIEEEFDAMTTPEKGYALAFSDGTLLHIKYDGGLWRINRLHAGTAEYSKIEAEENGDDYSDKVTLHAPIAFVICSHYDWTLAKSEGQE